MSANQVRVVFFGVVRCERHKAQISCDGLRRLDFHFRNRVKVHGCFHRTQIQGTPCRSRSWRIQKILEVPCRTVRIPHVVRLDEISDYRIPHIHQHSLRPHTAEMLLVSQQHTFFLNGAVNEHGRRYHLLRRDACRWTPSRL